MIIVSSLQFLGALAQDIAPRCGYALPRLAADQAALRRRARLLFATSRSGGWPLLRTPCPPCPPSPFGSLPLALLAVSLAPA